MSKEIAMYPCPLVYITQNSFTSEKGSHMNTPAIDLVGETKYARLYAPVTMKVASINKNSKSSEIIFHSCDKDGNDETKLLINNETGQLIESLLSFRFVHKVDVEMFQLGKIFTQGEYCYNTGTKGMRGVGTMPDHAHVEVALGHTKNVKMTDPRPNIQGQSLVGAVKPEKHFSLLKAVHKISTNSKDWKNGDGARGNKLLYVEDLNFDKYLICTTDNKMTLRHDIGGTILQWLKKGDKFLVNEVTEVQKDGYKYAKVLGGVIQIDENYIELYGFDIAEQPNPLEELELKLSKIELDLKEVKNLLLALKN